MTEVLVLKPCSSFRKSLNKEAGKVNCGDVRADLDLAEMRRSFMFGVKKIKWTERKEDMSKAKQKVRIVRGCRFIYEPFLKQWFSRVTKRNPTGVGIRHHTDAKRWLLSAPYRDDLPFLAFSGPGAKEAVFRYAEEYTHR